MEKPIIRFENNIKMKVIYLRFRGSYIEFRKHSKSMYEKLLDYAVKKGFYQEGKNMVMTIYHDNPFITKSKDLRTSVAMSVNDDISDVDDDEITLMNIEGKYAVGRFEIKLTEYGEAWNYMYHEWLFKSDSIPRDTFPFEMYVTRPPKNYKDTSTTDICIPIE
ncbi:MAG: GyrI-like domain-containing protein [Firmicutes bacterium]|nr:GyrI-like domain-containing protein [Bacillota bacterium]